jgi:hypothetical protein
MKVGAPLKLDRRDGGSSIARQCAFVDQPACSLATGFAFGMAYPDKLFAWAARLILFVV